MSYPLYPELQRDGDVEWVRSQGTISSIGAVDHDTQLTTTANEEVVVYHVTKFSDLW